MRSKDQILLENLYNEMAYPVSFSFEEFNNIRSHAGKLKYANERLQKLSSGSSRVVYKVDDEKVLKIAKNSKGLDQNSTESDYSLQTMYDIVAKVFESGDDNFWVEMELAKKTTPTRFKQLTGVSLKDVYDILWNLKTVNDAYQRRYRSPEELRKLENEQHEKIEGNEFLSQLWDMIGNYDMSYPADFARISSYGEVLRNGVPKIVLIDFGLTNTTWQTHYAK
jgi:mRNA-degrading endonuclease RelE of RelBE toxin-antitoxin system